MMLSAVSLLDIYVSCHECTNQPLQIIRVQQLLLPSVGPRLQLVPGFVDLALLAVGGVGGVTVRGHQAVGGVV